MKLRNLLAGALVVGLGAAAGPAAAQPETAESVDLERLQAQALEVADIRYRPMCDVRRPSWSSSDNPFDQLRSVHDCWDPRVEPAPLWG